MVMKRESRSYESRTESGWRGSWSVQCTANDFLRHGFGNHNDFNVDVRIIFWNINGFTEILKFTEISDWLYKDCDICFLSETHMTIGQNFNVDRFKCINHPFSDVFVKKPRGV